MPLDPVAHLTAQGWKGKGTGFKHDSLSRPLAVRMKTSLTGVGKDRDEAFPFWDHVFSAAAKSIIIPDPSSDGGSDDEADAAPTDLSAPLLSAPISSLPHQFQRTATGIISPFAPSSARSSAYTSPAPEPDSNNGLPSATGMASSLNMSIMASAKREAAKKGLYDRFNRGGWIKPHWDEYEPPKEEEKKAKSKAAVEKVEEVPKKEKRSKKEKDGPPGVVVQDVMASTATASSLPTSPKKEKRFKKSKSSPSTAAVPDPHHVPPPVELINKSQSSKSKPSSSSPKSSNMTGLITDPLVLLPSSSSSSSSSLPTSFNLIASPLATSTPLAEKKESKEDRRRRKQAERVDKDSRKEAKRLEKESRKQLEAGGSTGEEEGEGKRDKKRKRVGADDAGQDGASSEAVMAGREVKESKEAKRARKEGEKVAKEGKRRAKEEKKAAKASKKAERRIDV